MSSRLRIAWAARCLCTTLFCKHPDRESSAEAPPGQPAANPDRVSTLFTAARTDDVAKFNSVTASGFYIFDGGVRFNGEALMALVKAQHAAGKRYEWNVTEPDVHSSGIPLGLPMSIKAVLPILSAQ